MTRSPDFFRIPPIAKSAKSLPAFSLRPKAETLSGVEGAVEGWATALDIREERERSLEPAS